MLKAIKIKLYPSESQITYINKLLGTSRFVYNQCLNYKITEYQSNKKSTSFGEIGKFLISLKSEYQWIKESHSKVLQQQLINLDQAYKHFFRQETGFPKFKSKHDKQSCRFPVDAISGVKGNRINIINTLKNVHYKCSKSDEIYLNKNQDLIKSGTLSRNKCGNYYFSVLIDKPNKTLPSAKNNLIGLDLGIKDFIITSEGLKYENLKSKRNNKRKLARLHKELSRKQKGSNHQKEARIKLSKTYEKLNNIKEYYLHSIINQLLSENQTVVIEDLNVTGMLKNHKLARSIQELSLNRFKTMLTYKAEWYNREVIQVSQWFPSSKLCSVCGYKKNDLTLKDREWTCPECKTHHDRDLNAAINIKNEGKRIKIWNEVSFVGNEVSFVGLSSPKLTHQESKSKDPRRMMKENVKILKSY
jgi:putative transposase